MTDHPIPVTEPAIRRLVAGELSVLRRPIGPMLERVVVGDRLWVREPFFMPASLGPSIAPTVAVTRDARPAFAADFGPGMDRPAGYGPRQYARSLPKAWHRQHLVVTAVDRRPVQTLTEAEAHAEGYSSRDLWIAAWDRGVTMTDSSPNNARRWVRNPTVLVFTFKRLAVPVPDLASSPRAA